MKKGWFRLTRSGREVDVRKGEGDEDAIDSLLLFRLTEGIRNRSIIMIAVTGHESRSAEQSNQAVKRRQLSIPLDGVESTYLPIVVLLLDSSGLTTACLPAHNRHKFMSRGRVNIAFLSLTTALPFIYQKYTLST